jgi:hypothetical protein
VSSVPGLSHTWPRTGAATLLMLAAIASGPTALGPPCLRHDPLRVVRSRSVGHPDRGAGGAGRPGDVFAPLGRLLSSCSHMCLMGPCNQSVRGLGQARTTCASQTGTSCSSPTWAVIAAPGPQDADATGAGRLQARGPGVRCPVEPGGRARTEDRSPAPGGTGERLIDGCGAIVDRLRRVEPSWGGCSENWWERVTGPRDCRWLSRPAHASNAPRHRAAEATRQASPAEADRLLGVFAQASSEWTMIEIAAGLVRRAGARSGGACSRLDAIHLRAYRGAVHSRCEMAALTAGPPHAAAWDRRGRVI